MCRISILLVALAVALAAPACATQEQTGALAGAGVGAAAGNALTRGSFVGTIFGAAVGAAIGADIGRQLDDIDRRETAYALEHYRSGESYAWVNPDTGRSYSCTPTVTFYRRGAPCRDFILLTDIDGEPTEVLGTACRAPDGTWHAVQQ